MKQLLILFAILFSLSASAQSFKSTYRDTAGVRVDKPCTVAVVGDKISVTYPTGKSRSYTITLRRTEKYIIDIFDTQDHYFEFFLSTEPGKSDIVRVSEVWLRPDKVWICTYH